MKKYSGIFIYSVLVLNLFSCKVDPKLNPILPSNNLVQVVPEGWPKPYYNFEGNPITEERFILGRHIFYEAMLSKDNTISCADCHLNTSAFSNPGHEVSHGIENRIGTRNAPGMFNLAWHPYFMHDGGSSHIENQPIGPIKNPVEMDEEISSVIAKLQASQKYKTLFKNAYGDEAVTSERMLKSLAQFMGLINSSNSKYDKYKRREKDVEFSESELKGYALFRSKCNACHTEPLFSDFRFRNNGLQVNPAFQDSGRELISDALEDRYKFKTPSLRNVALTRPYMHDGRYNTLEECLDHYTNNITNYTNLDPLLLNGIPLTSQEKKDIISFLNTLTDFELINDKRFSDPNFK